MAILPIFYTIFIYISYFEVLKAGWGKTCKHVKRSQDTCCFVFIRLAETERSNADSREGPPAIYRAFVCEQNPIGMLFTNCKKSSYTSYHYVATEGYSQESVEKDGFIRKSLSWSVEQEWRVENIMSSHSSSDVRWKVSNREVWMTH